MSADPASSVTIVAQAAALANGTPLPTHAIILDLASGNPVCMFTGKVFAVQGGAISELAGWHDVKTIETEGPWLIDDIAARLP